MENYIFDYRLGYVRGGCALQGFDVLGADDAPLGRIVTLGGYTTPEQAKSHSSWADGLYKLTGGRCQIINGCTDGYSSAQELTMFVREAILLKPKLVICLSGFHNFANRLGFVRNKQDAELLKDHPFATAGQIEFFRLITPRFGLGNDKVYYGEERDVPAWEYWLEHMEMLRCLCSEFGMKLAAFLQPCIFSGNYRRSERENKLLCEHYMLTDAEIELFHGQFRQEYENGAIHAKDRSCIVNISNMFDSDLDIYVDAYHIRDEYTQKISGIIYSHMETEGFI